MKPPGQPVRKDDKHGSGEPLNLQQAVEAITKAKNDSVFRGGDFAVGPPILHRIKEFMVALGECGLDL